MNELKQWSATFRANFDKVVLLLLFLALVFVVLHLAAGNDREQISWAREAAGTVLGGLLGLITGARLSHPPPEQKEAGRE